MHGRSGGRLGALLALAAAVALIAPQAANGAIESVFGGEVACSVEPDGVRFCGSEEPRSTTRTFDGVPLDVNVAFPPAPASGPDGDYPLVMLFHGYGGEKIGLSAMRRWLDRGFATFSMTDRGFHESCGSAASRAADPEGCLAGYVRLDDTRYEVRDAQELSARLADEGVIDPRRLAAVGGSYGGGISLALAVLRDRKMLPDGSLVPWESPAGVELELAAAAPFITWSDLAYSLAPNGGTLDYAAKSPYRGRFGVMKESLVNGLYISGLAAPGHYAAPGTPGADLTGWKTLFDAGEPYDGNPETKAIIDELTRFHSAYYIPMKRKPAPVLFSNGFTDDLFGADEAIRFANKAAERYPKAVVSMLFGEIAGHPRSTQKPAVSETLEARTIEWFEHFVAGRGERPFTGVQAFTQTCPADAAPGGPYFAKSWARIAPGEVRLRAKEARVIAAGAGDPEIARTFDPVSGDGACAETSGADQPGTATYRTRPAPEGGFTLLGSPTVIAKFTLPGDTSQVAARLLDVSPEGTQRLIARGLWRPVSGGPEKQVFQLHPNGWHFDAGHVAKLELLPADSGGAPLNSYGRRSNDQQDVTVSNLKLRLPVRERPGSLDGLVRAPARKFLPEGAKLARDHRGRDPRAKLAKGELEARGSEVSARVRCPRLFATCSEGSIAVSAGSAGRARLAEGTFDLEGGETETVRLALTKAGERALAGRASIRVLVETRSAEAQGRARQRRTLLAE